MNEKFINFELYFMKSLLSNGHEKSKRCDMNNQPLVAPYSIGLCYSYLINFAQSDHITAKAMRLMKCEKGISFQDYLHGIKDIRGIIEASQQSLKTANMIFTNMPLSFTEMFGIEFSPSIVEMDYLDSPSSIINKAVKSKTNGRISRFMNPMMKFSQRNWGMSSVSIFENRWRHEFDGTFLRTFHSFDGKIKAPMMQMKARNIYFYQDKNAFAVKLPFKDSHYSFIGIMPNKKGRKHFGNLLMNMDYSQFTNLVNSGKKKKMNVIIPKFSVSTSSFNLFKNAEELGFGKKLLFKNLSFFCQKCSFCINEKGTIPEKGDNSMAFGKKIKVDRFSFNRPFLYMIVHNDLDVIILSGAVTMGNEEYSE